MTHISKSEKYYGNITIIPFITLILQSSNLIGAAGRGLVVGFHPGQYHLTLLTLLLIHVEISVGIYQIQSGAKDHGLVINTCTKSECHTFFSNFLFIAVALL